MSEIPGPGRGRKDHLTFRTILTYHSLLHKPGPFEIWEGGKRKREDGRGRDSYQYSEGKKTHKSANGPKGPNYKTLSPYVLLTVGH